jgi:hypothetical protein
MTLSGVVAHAVIGVGFAHAILPLLRIAGWL